MDAEWAAPSTGPEALPTRDRLPRCSKPRQHSSTFPPTHATNAQRRRRAARPLPQFLAATISSTSSSRPPNYRGIVWHTPRLGKSLTMVFAARNSCALASRTYGADRHLPQPTATRPDQRDPLGLRVPPRHRLRATSRARTRADAGGTADRAASWSPRAEFARRRPLSETA